MATLQTLSGFSFDAGKVGGFSLHAGVSAREHESAKLERLCRYITRPAVCEKRIALTTSGQVRYALKTPWRDGTTHIMLEPVEFLARLAALVPPPRAHLTRFHGVFAPNAKLRAQLTAAGQGKGAVKRDTTNKDGVLAPSDATTDHRTPEERRHSMTPDHVRGRLWAQRLKRV